MHIVYVTGMFADQDGDVLTGMPNYIYKIAKYMKSKGHNTSILTTGKKINSGIMMGFVYIV